MKKQITTFACVIGLVFMATGCEPKKAEDPQTVEEVDVIEIPSTSDIAEQVSAAGDAVSDQVSQVGDTVTETVGNVTDSVNETVDDVMSSPEVAAVTEVITDSDSAADDAKMESKRAMMCKETDMPGSWQVSEVTPEVKQAVKVLDDAITSDSPIKQVNDVRVQVVNGTNYAIEVELDNGELWYGKIYRNLRNDYMMDSVAVKGKMCP